MERKVLVFDVSGRFAHFKQIHTTTSPLTYSIPPKTALSGMLACVLGKDRDTYYDDFSAENFEIGIKIKKPIKKQRININYLSTEEDSNDVMNLGKDFPESIERKRIPLEVVHSPEYRIYFWVESEELREDILDLFQKGKSVYTPYLGLSEFIANIEFKGSYEAKKRTSEGVVIIDTVLPVDTYDEIEPEPNKRYRKEKVPTEMSLNEKGERYPSEYKPLMIESRGKPVKVDIRNYHEIAGDNCVLF